MLKCQKLSQYKKYNKRGDKSGLHSIRIQPLLSSRKSISVFVPVCELIVYSAYSHYQTSVKEKPVKINKGLVQVISNIVFLIGRLYFRHHWRMSSNTPLIPFIDKVISIGLTISWQKTITLVLKLRKVKPIHLVVLMYVTKWKILYSNICYIS